MSNEVKRKTKKVEVEVVELKIELSAEFFDKIEMAKQEVAKQRGYDTSYGQYIEEAMDDLVTMLESYTAQLHKASEIIKGQDEALGVAPTKKEAPVDPETDGPDEVPESMYAHLAENYDNDPMVV